MRNLAKGGRFQRIGSQCGGRETRRREYAPGRAPGVVGGPLRYLRAPSGPCVENITNNILTTCNVTINNNYQIPALRQLQVPG